MRNAPHSHLLTLAAILAAFTLCGCPFEDLRMNFFATPVQGPAPLRVQFDADARPLAPFEIEQKLRGDGGKVINILSFFWDFGDGAQATGRRAHHTYTLPGVYDVRLSVTYTVQTLETLKQVQIQHLVKEAFITVH